MTEKQVKKELKKVGGKWEDFIKWMFGQTVGINKDGSTDYYDRDVRRFISSDFGKKNEHWYIFD